MTACRGFVWVGQPFTSCDECGRPAWEHDGELIPAEGYPFGEELTFRPWAPGEADGIRRHWGGAS